MHVAILPEQHFWIFVRTAIFVSFTAKYFCTFVDFVYLPVHIMFCASFPEDHFGDKVFTSTLSSCMKCSIEEDVEDRSFQSLSAEKFFNMVAKAAGHGQ